MNFDQIMWGKKKFSDLLKDIHNNSKEKEAQIKELIKDLSPLVKDPQSALMIVPLIAEYIGISVKNDEQMVKLASIVQRALSNSTTDKDGNEVSLTEAEKEQLFAEAKAIGGDSPKK